MQARKKSPAPTPRRRPKTPFAVFTVDAILAAVERILEHDGPDALTTNRVAELAGVSIGTLYQYFPNKDALVGALQDSYAEDTLRRVRDAIAGAEALPLRAVLARIGEALLAAKHAQRPIHRWLIDWRTAAGCWDRYRGALDQHVDLVAAFLSARPDVTVADPRAAAFVLVHAVEGVIEAVSERANDGDGAIEAQRIVATAADMVAAFLDA